MVLSIYTLFLSMSTKIFSRFFSLPQKMCTLHNWSENILSVLEKRPFTH